MRSIRGVFIALTILCGASLFLLFFSLSSYFSSINEVSEARKQQYASYLLADELRQSSDDLTRLGRTYVVTGDGSYKQQYMDILAIRNGKKPRPKDYHRIYWDFVAAGNATPRPADQSIALAELMRQVGFTEEEFGKLNEAKANSDGLVNLEVEAMNLVEGNDKDGNPTGTTDLDRARQLVHSDAYHEYKSQIMKPVDDFFILLEERTNNRIATAENSAQSNWTYTVISASMLAMFVICLIVFTYIRIIRGVERVQGGMGKIVSGDLNVQLPDQSRSDEIGAMAQQVAHFRDAVVEKLALEEKQQKDKAEFEEAMASQRHELGTEFENKVASFMEEFDLSLGGMRDTAGKLVSIAATTSENSSAALGEAESASSNVQNMASAAEEMAASVREISDRLVTASAKVTEATNGADATNAQISKLVESSQRIGVVVNLIQDIAEQTNLLALNATIEAARAGESGRGFAVVASEVKELAGQTAKATDDISAQVSEIQAATEGSLTAIQTITGTIREISEFTTAISETVEQQSEATSEISDSAQQSARSTNVVASTMSNLKSSIHDSQAEVGQVNERAQEISDKAQALSKSISAFVTKMVA